jgi:FkbM family methyltransferase
MRGSTRALVRGAYWQPPPRRSGAAAESARGSCGGLSGLILPACIAVSTALLILYFYALHPTLAAAPQPAPPSTLRGEAAAAPRAAEAPIAAAALPPLSAAELAAFCSRQGFIAPQPLLPPPLPPPAAAPCPACASCPACAAAGAAAGAASGSVLLDVLGVEADVARAAVAPSLALAPSDPNYAECHGYLTHGQSPGASFTTFQSQFGQDAYLYRNFFLGKAKGFYLDVGANAPKELSNTWFFDKCLGWAGICVEASPTRAQQLREQRSCKVVHACAWDAKKTLMLSGADANSINDHLASGGSVAVECRTIDDILAAERVSKIDLFSLDIESAEPQALRGMDVRRWAPDVVTVETFWLNQTFHNSMFDLGYAITGFVGPDTIYVRRAAPHVVNAAHMTWGRNNIDNFRNEEQGRTGRCFDSIANPVRVGRGPAFPLLRTTFLLTVTYPSLCINPGRWRSLVLRTTYPPVLRFHSKTVTRCCRGSAAGVLLVPGGPGAAPPPRPAPASCIDLPGCQWWLKPPPTPVKPLI